MIGKLDGKVPPGPLEQKWRNHKNNSRLVSPNNRRKFEIIVVGSGLAGGSAAATLGELGYRVKCFCYQDSPRRAHSIAAQGGINAAKNYQNDGDSVFRLFYDTIKGGDFRSREGNVYRLAEVSNLIIDQCTEQGVPFAREYGGPARQSFLRRVAGFTDVLRPWPNRPAASARRLSGPLPASRARHGENVPSDRDARPRSGRWSCQGNHQPQSLHRGNRCLRRRCRSSCDRWLRQCFFFRPTRAVATSPPPIALTNVARSLVIPASPKFIPPASQSPVSINPN
mgnify:CR=1 FL=1